MLALGWFIRAGEAVGHCGGIQRVDNKFRNQLPVLHGLFQKICRREASTQNGWIFVKKMVIF